MRLLVLQAGGSGDSDTPMTDLLLGHVAQGLAGLYALTWIHAGFASSHFLFLCWSVFFGGFVHQLLS